MYSAQEKSANCFRREKQGGDRTDVLRGFVRHRFAEIAGGFLYSIILSTPGVSVFYQGQVGRPGKEKGTGDRIALSPDPTVVM